MTPYRNSTSFTASHNLTWLVFELPIKWSIHVFIIHAPLFRGGADHVYESPSGDSCLVMNIQNQFMHCATSQ